MSADANGQRGRLLLLSHGWAPRALRPKTTGGCNFMQATADWLPPTFAFHQEALMPDVLALCVPSWRHGAAAYRSSRALSGTVRYPPLCRCARVCVCVCGGGNPFAPPIPPLLEPCHANSRDSRDVRRQRMTRVAVASLHNACMHAAGAAVITSSQSPQGPVQLRPALRQPCDTPRAPLSHHRSW